MTARFLRHFNTIGYVEMSDDSKDTIFSTILNHWLKSFPTNPAAFVALGDAIVKVSWEWRRGSLFLILVYAI